MILLAALLGGIATASGADGAPRLRLGVWPGSFYQTFVAHQRAAGRTGLALEPLCREEAPGLQVCVTVLEGDAVRPVSLRDVERWGTSAEAVRRQAVSEAKAGFAAQVVRSELEGLGPWWMRSQADGWDGAALLLPDALEAMVGGPVVLAVPAQGSALFWAHGNPDLDRAVAVGVRRAAEAAQRPVSDTVYRWTGKEWVVWARAEKAPPPG